MPQARKYASARERQAAYRARTEAARAAQLQARGLPSLPAIPTVAGSARWKAALHQAHQLLASIRDEMQAYAQDRSDSWQESERGQLHEERIAALEEIVDALADLEW